MSNVTHNETKNTTANLSPKKQQSKLDKLFNTITKSSNSKKTKTSKNTDSRKSSNVSNSNPGHKLSDKSTSEKTASESPKKANVNPTYTQDEYQGLSYKTNKATPVKTVDLYPEAKNEVKVEQPVKKKSIERDFRIKYKTEKCKFFETNKECKFGDNCAFAHGLEDIREKVIVTNNYKTKRCKQFFESGYCPYGSRCQFLHRESPKSSSKFCPQFSYTKTISDLINSVNSENILNEEKMSRPRLKTFESLVKEKDYIGPKHKLYEDILSIKREDIYLYDMTLVPAETPTNSRSRFMSA